MSSVDEARIQVAIDELRIRASQFFEASQSIQLRASHLSGISLDLTYSANDWAGTGSDEFQNAWSQYDRDTQKAIESLSHTGNVCNNLAQRLEYALEIKKQAEQRANGLLLATVGLTLIDVIQLGMDPFTDAALAGTAAGAAVVAASAVDLGALVVEADIAAEGELAVIETTEVGALATIDQALIDYGLPPIEFGPPFAFEYPYEFVSPIGDSRFAPTEIIPLNNNEVTSKGGVSLEGETNREDGKGSLYIGVGANYWDKHGEANLGQLDGAPVTLSSEVDVGHGSIGFGAVKGENGDTYYGLEGRASLFKASDNLSIGSKDRGLTGSVETEVGGVEGFVGMHDKSIGAEVGVVGVTDTGSVGVNLGGKNVSVDGTIGLKAEFGFQIGPHTEIKLPFFSFGFSFGDAK